MIDIASALAGIRVITQIYNVKRGQPQTFTNTLRTSFATMDMGTLVENPLGRIGTAGVAFRDGNGTNVCLCGVLNEGHGRTLAAGYLNGPAIRASDGFNPEVWTEAQRWMETIHANFSFGMVRLNLFGHSSGGAVCEALAHLAGTRLPGVQVHLNTYGAPMAKSSDVNTRNFPLTRQRWIHLGDVVPYVPWVRLTNGEAVWLVVTSRAPIVMSNDFETPSNFFQPGEGIVLPGAPLRGADFPSLPDRVQNMFERLRVNEFQAVRAHASATYQRSLEIVQRSLGNTTKSVFPTHFNVNQPVRVTKVTLGPNVAAILPANAMVPIVIRPNGIASDVSGRELGVFQMESVPMAFLKINPKKAFRMVRVGRQWQVCIGERVVAVADTPKRPRTLVKRLNGMLRAVGTDNTIWLDSILSGLRDWMTNASSDETFCRPTMRVDL